MTNLNKITPIIGKTEQLPLMLMTLSDWSFITVTGIDAEKYLQSKLTADITMLTTQQHIFTAHCNAKGKIWSTLRLFRYKKGFGYILRSSVAKKQLNELEKYSVFSQVIIKQQPNIVLLGIAGQNARNILDDYFPQLKNKKESVMHIEQTILLDFDTPYERLLVVTDSHTSTNLKKYFYQYSNNQQWLALDIASGFANIDIENSELFIPQAVNLQALPNSISFQKGCYSGQETIAKAKYRGTNKRAMYWLYGTSNTLPKIGEAIECKINDDWRSTGTVLAAVDLLNGYISIQVVMNNNITKKNFFRVSGEKKSKLIIQPLPYLLR